MSYCSSLKDFQVINVLNDERDRMKRFDQGSDGFKAASELYQEAREELLRRGFEPDEELRTEPE